MFAGSKPYFVVSKLHFVRKGPVQVGAEWPAWHRAALGIAGAGQWPSVKSLLEKFIWRPSGNLIKITMLLMGKSTINYPFSIANC
jgi:hypothetical protein